MTTAYVALASSTLGQAASTLFGVVEAVGGFIAILLVVFFVAGRVTGRLQRPVAIVVCLLIINVCVHMRIGMNEVIEDYLDEDKTNRLGKRANTAFAILVAATTVISVVKILVWG